MKTTELRCIDCDRLLIKPLFFLIDGDDWRPICHKCAERLVGPAIVKSLGGWTYELTGSVSLTKVRR